MDSKHKSYTSSTLKEIRDEYVGEERVINRLSGGLQMEERPPPNKRIKPRDMDLGRRTKTKGKNCEGEGNHPEEELECSEVLGTRDSGLLLISLLD